MIFINHNNNYIMNIVDFISWIGVLVSIGTSVIRALNVGYQWHTYIMSSLSGLALIYNGYQLGSNQLIFLNTFHMIISLMGVYRWT